MELACTLRRKVGRPVTATTLNVGAGGMLITSARPLPIDEELLFDLEAPDVPVSGQARVLRHEVRDVYALRFERLPAQMANRLHALATGA